MKKSVQVGQTQAVGQARLDCFFVLKMGSRRHQIDVVHEG